MICNLFVRDKYKTIQIYGYTLKVTHSNLHQPKFKFKEGHYIKKKHEYENRKFLYLIYMFPQIPSLDCHHLCHQSAGP